MLLLHSLQQFLFTIKCCDNILTDILMWYSA